jgi:ribosome-binding protein aMBF1 (putative translation factor)
MDDEHDAGWTPYRKNLHPRSKIDPAIKQGRIEFGARLRAEREKRGSMRSVAAEIGINRTKFNSWELGEASPSLTEFRTLKKLFPNLEG